MLTLGPIGANADNFSKRNHSQIKDIDPIMSTFDTALPCNSSDAP